MEKVKCFAHFYADDGTNGDNKYYLVDVVALTDRDNAISLPVPEHSRHNSMTDLVRYIVALLAENNFCVKQYKDFGYEWHTVHLIEIFSNTEVSVPYMYPIAN